MESRTEPAALTNPSTIWVKSSLNVEWAQVPPEQFATEHGFDWQEHISTTEQITSQDTSPELDEIFAQIATYRDRLGIVYMGETVGYGLFARESIPKGVYITLYAGELTYLTESGLTTEHSNPYAVTIHNKNGDITGVICAERKRNMGAIAQGVPTSQLEYSYSGAIHLYRVAVATIQISQFTYQGQPILAYQTISNIPKDCLLGWDYGNLYWRALEIVPQLFTWNGEIMDPDTYHASSLCIYVNSGKIGDESSITANFTIDQLMKIFNSNNNLLLLGAKELDEIWGISKDDFMEKYRKRPQSPFMIFDKPSKVIKPNENKKQSSEQTKPPRTTENSETPQQSSVTNFAGLFPKERKDHQDNKPHLLYTRQFI